MTLQTRKIVTKQNVIHVLAEFESHSTAPAFKLLSK